MHLTEFLHYSTVQWTLHVYLGYVSASDQNVVYIGIIWISNGIRL